MNIIENTKKKLGPFLSIGKSISNSTKERVSLKRQKNGLPRRRQNMVHEKITKRLSVSIVLPIRSIGTATNIDILMKRSVMNSSQLRKCRSFTENWVNTKCGICSTTRFGFSRHIVLMCTAGGLWTNHCQ